MRLVGTLTTLIVAAVALGGCSSLATVSRKALNRAPAGFLAVVDVNLVTMETEEVLMHQTLIIEGERIVSFGNAASTPVPEGAAIVPGEGRYLLPGFADMHVHLSDENDMLKCLRSGVTTVRHMADVPLWAKAMGFVDVLSLRERQRRREVLGPDIYACGPVLDGRPAVSPMNRVIADARQADQEVRREHKAGYDFIKIYDNLPREAFDAVLRSARECGMSVIGHVPYQVGIDRALAAPMDSIEHLTGYIDNNTAGFLVPEAVIPAYAERTRVAGVYNCPTLVIWDGLPPEKGLAVLKADPSYASVPWQLKWLWGQTLSKVYQITYPDKAGYARRMLEISERMVKALWEAGCPLLVGTDANFLGTYPGRSTLREMELLAEAGVPSYDVLRAATVVPARFLGREKDIGKIAAGKIANLVLLEDNPLQDIRSVRRTVGVFTHGTWLGVQDLDTMIGGRAP